MKITKTTVGSITTYLYDGVKRYKHYKDLDGYESWIEYDKDGNQIHLKDSHGNESWSNDNPENPENWIKEEDVRAFEFGSNK